MNQISLAVINTICFKTILTLIRRPMYHFSGGGGGGVVFPLLYQNMKIREGNLTAAEYK